MKYCKDCKWYIDVEDFSTVSIGEKPVYRTMKAEKCSSPNIPRHMVTGEKQNWTALHSRNLPITGCGELARWFESIEDADLDDLSNIPFGK